MLVDINDTRRVAFAAADSLQARDDRFLKREKVGGVKRGIAARFHVSPKSQADNYQGERHKNRAKVSRVGGLQPTDERESAHDNEQTHEAEHKEDQSGAKIHGIKGLILQRRRNILPPVAVFNSL